MMNRIKKRFASLRSKGQKAFIPYIMAGDPSLEETKRLFLLLEKSGADIIELGVPFSDPLADGPVIQRAAERALLNGVTLKGVISLVKEIRASSEVPIVLMTYYNPVFKYGDARFVADASSAGADGVIIPDLPPEEAGVIIKEAKSHDFSAIFLLAPTSPPERIKKIAGASSGFIYYVSITGITGAELRLEGLRESVKAVRSRTKKPVAVGFGVSTPEEARAVAETSDGVIVGSAIIKHMGPDLEEFAKALGNAIHGA